MSDQTTASLFENEQVWATYGLDHTANIAPDQRQRRQAIQALLPVDTTSVLDVGCGNGIILDTLPPSWSKIGLDLSMAALRHVQAPAVYATALHLPFPDAAFDGVLSLEMLEHLSSAQSDLAVAEMQRLARRWLLIGVPDREVRENWTIRCPNCHQLFHVWGHLQSFTQARIDGWFPQDVWKKSATLSLGAEINYPPAWQAKLMLAAGGRYHTPAQNTVCPNCNNLDFAQLRQPLGRAPRVMRRLFRRLARRGIAMPDKRPFWRLALYERR